MRNGESRHVEVESTESRLDFCQASSNRQHRIPSDLYCYLLLLYLQLPTYKPSK